MFQGWRLRLSHREQKSQWNEHTLHVQDGLVGVTVDGPLLLHLVLQLKDGLLQLLHLVVSLVPSLLQGIHLAAELLLPPLSPILNLLAFGLCLCMCGVQSRIVLKQRSRVSCWSDYSLSHALRSPLVQVKILRSSRHLCGAGFQFGLDGAFLNLHFSNN